MAISTAYITTAYITMGELAKSQGFTVTSTIGDTHATNSKHYKGEAIDVRTKDKTDKQVEDFMAFMRQKGYRVIDERKRTSANWTAEHLHIEWLSTTEKVVEQLQKPINYAVIGGILIGITAYIYFVRR